VHCAKRFSVMVPAMEPIAAIFVDNSQARMKICGRAHYPSIFFLRLSGRMSVQTSLM
jgi:hypothetical protein